MYYDALVYIYNLHLKMCIFYLSVFSVVFGWSWSLIKEKIIACASKNEQEAKAKGLGWLYNGVVGGSNPKQDDKCQ